MPVIHYDRDIYVSFFMTGPEGMRQIQNIQKQLHTFYSEPKHYKNDI